MLCIAETSPGPSARFRRVAAVLCGDGAGLASATELSGAVMTGRTTGVAPGCTLHAIKVLGSKSSSDQYAFRGIRMALAHWRAVSRRDCFGACG